MCGVWGFITTAKGNGALGRSRFVEQASVTGVLRGPDSTGTIIIPHNLKGAADWCKAVGSGEDFWRSKYANEKLTMSRFNNLRAVLGHNRSATRGSVTVDNAHPFQEGDITLIHNGTLLSTYGLPTPGHALKDKKVDVDSHAICHNLALHPAKEVLERLDGAFTLIWHDARTNGIYMARNHQRPLFLMRAKCEDTVLFASEPDMLYWLAGRNNFARDTIYSVDAHVLLEFKEDSTKPHASKFTPHMPGYNYAAAGEGRYARGKGGQVESTGGGKIPSTEFRSTTQRIGSNTTKKASAWLAEFGLTPKETIEFSPVQVIVGRERSLVSGHAYIIKPSADIVTIQALIYGVETEFANKNLRMEWEVRPMGVKMLEDQQGALSPALLCRLIRVIPGTEGGGSPDDGDPFEMYPGPNKEWLSSRDWLIATEGGCSQCQKALILDECDSIAWTAGSLPVCPTCVDHWRTVEHGNC